MSVDPELVSGAFGLGRPQGELAPAARGELGVIWHLDTDQGQWAVKELLAPEEETGSDVELQLAALAAGLPLPRPVLTPDRQPIVVCGAVSVRVYEWVDVDPDGLCPPDVAGALLAGIHRLSVAPGDSHWFYHRPLGAEGWARVQERADSSSSTAWGPRLAALLAELRRAEQRWVSGLPPGEKAVRGHMDFNRDNVRMRRDGRPVIFDWENAAATHADQEVAMAAHEFLVGLPVNTGDRTGLAAARSFVDGYRRAGGRFEPSGPQVFAMAFVCQAHLLDLYSERACAPGASGEQRERATENLCGMTARPLTPALADQLLDVWAE